MKRARREYVVPTWEQHSAEDVEIGMGIELAERRMCLVFDRYVRVVWFDAGQLDEYIAALQRQRMALEPQH